MFPVPIPYLPTQKICPLNAKLKFWKPCKNVDKLISRDAKHAFDAKGCENLDTFVVECKKIYG